MSERVAIIDGLRTPFAKRGDALAAFDAVDLGTAVVSELVERNGLDGDTVDQVVFGRVILDVELPNIAREIVLNSHLPDEIEAYSVSEACITSYRTTVNAAAATVNTPMARPSRPSVRFTAFAEPTSTSMAKGT